MRNVKEPSREELTKDAIHYGYVNPNGHYGCDMDILCSLGYFYIANRKHCDTAFMFLLDPNIDDQYNRTTETGKDDYIGACHALASMSLFKKPTKHRRGKSARIDPTTPGLNCYYIPQVMKHSFVTNKEFFTMSETERAKHRTAPTKRKNDWMRKVLVGERKKAEWLQKNKGIPIDETYFKKKYEETFIDDELDPMTGRCGYSSEDVLAFHDIVLDIDDHHDPAIWVQQMADRVTDILVNGCDEDGVIVSLPVYPHFIVKTGRGIQLHFLIKPVFGTAKSMAYRCVEGLCDIYRPFLDTYGTNLEIDIESSKNLAGFKRLPDTYNSKAPDKNGRWCFKCTKHNSKMAPKGVWKIENLMRTLGLKVYDNVEEYKKRLKEVEGCDNACSSSHKYDSSIPHYSNVRSKRFVEFFRSYANNIQQGMRNDFLFMAGTLAKEAGTDVKSYVLELNNSLSEPLSSREAAKVARSANKHDYHYTTKRITQSLGLTADELKPYGLTLQGARVSNYERNKATHLRHEKRDLEVVTLLNNGESVSAVSRITGLCRETIRSIRDRGVKKIEEKQAEDKNLSDQIKEAVANRIDDIKGVVSNHLKLIRRAQQEINETVSLLDFDIDRMSDYIRLTS